MGRFAPGDYLPACHPFVRVNDSQLRRLSRDAAISFEAAGHCRLCASESILFIGDPGKKDIPSQCVSCRYERAGTVQKCREGAFRITRTTPVEPVIYNIRSERLDRHVVGMHRIQMSFQKNRPWGVYIDEADNIRAVR
jgi:hypothetical protein